MVPTLQSIETPGDLSLEELVEAADRVLAEVAPSQTRWKVTERPDARTIRYYVTRGLLPKPHSYAGGRARYGRSHLVRLALLKRLQAEHHTLDQIARVLAPASDAEVIAQLSDVGRTPRPPIAQPSSPPPSSPALPPSSSTLTSPATPLTLELAPAARVVVPRAAVKTAADRAQLADNLERLAAWLRAMDDDPSPADQDPAVDRDEHASSNKEHT